MDVEQRARELLAYLKFLWRRPIAESSYYMDNSMRWRRDRGLPTYLQRHVNACGNLREVDRHAS